MEAQSTNAVRAGRGRTLVVTWKNGAESPVDVSEHLGRFEVFRPLRDDTDAFRAATVGEWGWNAHWSDDMEISADTLWRLALDRAPPGCCRGGSPGRRSCPRPRRRSASARACGAITRPGRTCCRRRCDWRHSAWIARQRQPDTPLRD